MAPFQIEALYFPAREVGGDFFQILQGDDKSLLIVLGDIAGKGLPAAMLVALLIGTIRTTARNTRVPSHLLAALNHSLCMSTQGGFTTCAALNVSIDGTLQIANAGHPPPHVNGKELTMEGSLPFGVATNVEFSVQSLALAPGDRLLLFSDGVPEAKNDRGELFGFERLAAITNQAASEIANAARAFGQADDITVLSVSIQGISAGLRY